MKIFKYLFAFLFLLLMPLIGNAEVKISLLKFENKGRGEFDYLERSISNMFENDLFCLEGITVLERTRTGEFIDELYLNQLFEGGFDENKLQKLGKSFISDYILSGEIKVDDNILNAKAKLFSITENKFVLENSFSDTIANTLLIEKAIITEICKYLSISEKRRKNFVINIKPKPTLAISYFDGYIPTGELSQLRKGLADLFIADLSRTGLFKVVERENLQKVLEELKLQDTAMISSRESLKLGKLLGAELLLLGAYTKIKDKLRIDIKTVKVESGELIAVYTAEDDTKKFGKILSVLVKDIVDSCRVEQSVRLSEQLPQIEKRTLESTIYISKALYCEDWRQYEEAVKNYSNAMYVNPSLDKELLLRIARLYWEVIRNVDMAAKYYEFYLGKYPEPEYFFELAGCYYDGADETKDNCTKALEVYEHIIKNYPAYANRARGTMAIFYFQKLKDYEKALRIYKDMLKEVKDDFEASNIKEEIIKCLIELNVQDEIIEPYANSLVDYIFNKESQDSLINHIDKVPSWINLNWYLKITSRFNDLYKIKLKRYEIVKNIIDNNKNLFNKPKYRQAYRCLLGGVAEAEYSLGMYDVAEKHFQEFTKLFPESADAAGYNSYLHRISLNRKKIPKLKSKISFANTTEKVGLTMELATCYLDEEAKKILWDLLEKESISDELKVRVLHHMVNNIIKPYRSGLRRSEYEEGVKIYKKILELKSNDINVYFSLAECLEKLGDYGEAIRFYKEYLQLNPHNKLIKDKLKLCESNRDNRGSLFERAEYLAFSLDIPEKALPYFEGYLKEFPNAERSKDGLCQFYIARCYEIIGEYGHALKEYEKLALNYPSRRSTAHAKKAEIFEKLGDYSTAEKELLLTNDCEKLAKLYLYKIRNYEKAIFYLQILKSSGADTAEYYIARAYERLENYDEAIKHYELFLKEYPDTPLAKKFGGHIPLPTDCLDVHHRISKLRELKKQ